MSVRYAIDATSSRSLLRRQAAMLAAAGSLATFVVAFSKFAFVGAGKMAEAMLAPLQDTTIENATPICVLLRRVACLKRSPRNTLRSHGGIAR